MHVLLRRNTQGPCLHSPFTNCWRKGALYARSTNHSLLVSELLFTCLLCKSTRSHHAESVRNLVLSAVKLSHQISTIQSRILQAIASKISSIPLKKNAPSGTGQNSHADHEPLKRKERPFPNKPKFNYCPAPNLHKHTVFRGLNGQL